MSGASVATTARSEPAAGQAPALSIKADLGTARGVQNVVDRIQQAWGGLDVLVNNVSGTELAQNAYFLYVTQDPREQSKLLRKLFFELLHRRRKYNADFQMPLR